MGKCPVCQHSVPDDFGLIECDNCKAQLLVHMDGTVEHASHQAMDPDPPPAVFPPQQPEALAEPSDEAPVADALENSLEVEAMGGLNETADEDLSSEAEFTEATNPSHPHIYSEEALIESVAEEPRFTAEPDAGVAPEEAAPAPPEEIPAEVSFEDAAEPNEEPVVYSSEPAPEPKNPADLSDLADFGNADLASGREGPLRYTLFISGIDTKDVRESFREALTDRKFVWDTDQILKSIREGQVKIENASATKAYMLVIRLRNLPLQVRWEQYVVHQP